MAAVPPEEPQAERPLSTHFADIIAIGEVGYANDSKLEAIDKTNEYIEALVKQDLSVCKEFASTAVNNENARNLIFQLKGQTAQDVMESLIKWLDGHTQPSELRGKVLHILVKLASQSGQLPSSLFLRDVQYERDPTNRSGGIADVHRGRHGGASVAVKVLRKFEHSKLSEQHVMLCREALIWRQLRHKNVLPFLGLVLKETGEVKEVTKEPSNSASEVKGMVAPWMEHGSLKAYMQGEDYDPERDRYRIFREVSEGLEYLHSQKIAHSDLKAANILIDRSRRAYLADFGLSLLTEAFTGNTIASNRENGGTIAWMAPERIQAQLGTLPILPSDVYSLGLLSVMMYTKREPYEAYPLATFFKSVIEKPARPQDMGDALWELTERCWATSPEERPKMNEVISTLDSINNPKSRRSPKDGVKVTSFADAQPTSQRHSLVEPAPAYQPELGSSTSDDVGRSPIGPGVTSQEEEGKGENLEDLRKPTPPPEAPATHNSRAPTPSLPEHPPQLSDNTKGDTPAEPQKPIAPVVQAPYSQPAQDSIKNGSKTNLPSPGGAQIADPLRSEIINAEPSTNKHDTHAVDDSHADIQSEASPPANVGNTPVFGSQQDEIQQAAADSTRLPGSKEVSQHQARVSHTNNGNSKPVGSRQSQHSTREDGHPDQELQRVRTPSIIVCSIPWWKRLLCCC